MIRARRDLRQNPDIWPGFVDALSTLLLVIIFLLVVFVLAQFFLNQLLQGKDTQLQTLEQAVAQLTEQLNLEQASNAELRLSVAQLSSDLQSAQADRDDTAALLAEAEAERDQFRDQVFLLEDDKALLTQTLNEMRQQVARNEDLEAELQRSVDLRARLQEELEQARESTKAEATEEIARLADLLEAAQAETAKLQTQVAEMSQTVTASEQETASLEAEVTRLTQLLEATRAEQAASTEE